MLLHPVFKTLASQPELLAEHAGAYVQLATAEVGVVASQMKVCAALAAAALACATLGLSLAGTAVLLLAVVPLAEMPAPWALALAPALPLGGAAALWWVQARQTIDLSFEAVRGQLALDRSLWQRVSES